MRQPIAPVAGAGTPQLTGPGQSASVATAMQNPPDRSATPLSALGANPLPPRSLVPQRLAVPQTAAPDPITRLNKDDLPPDPQPQPQAPDLPSPDLPSPDLPSPDLPPAPQRPDPALTPPSLPSLPALTPPALPGLIPPALPPSRPAPTVAGPLAHALAHALPGGLHATLVKAATTARRDDQVELTLAPVELGRVRFALATSGDQVQVTLSVERPETLDLLRRHAEDLRAEFRAAGFGGAALNFGHWGQNQRGEPDPVAFAETAAATPPQPMPRTRFAAPGLDLRL